MEASLLHSESELQKAAGILLQLRAQYSLEEMLDSITLQREQGYQLAAVQSENEIVSVAGFIVGRKLAWRKYLYIDDLVTDQKYRSSGAGALLLDWLKSHAIKIGCEQIHLDSGVQKFPAHRFYLRQRFNIASHHFSLTDVGI